MDTLEKILLIALLVVLASCGTAQKKTAPRAHVGKAEVTVFFKSESDYRGKSPYLFLDHKVLGRVPPRGSLTVSTSAGSARLSLKGLRAGLPFTEWQAKKIALSDNDRLFLVYDQSTWVISAITEQRLADFRAQYPVVERKSLGIAENLVQTVALPILLPGIVVFSAVTGEAVQQGEKGSVPFSD